MVPGSVTDVDVLRDAAATSDGVIHLAFDQDAAFDGRFQQAADHHRGAIATFGEALSGSDRPLVVVSGTSMLRPGTIGTEQDEADLNGPAGARVAGDLTALSFAARGVRSSVVRLPPTNHGEGDNGGIATMVAIAQLKGESHYVGDGTNRWPAVHRLDSAHLLRLALESAPAGSVLHGVAEESVTGRDIGEAIGRLLNVPTVSITAERAVEIYGFLGHLLAADNPASSTFTRERMGWQPEQPGLIQDIQAGHYFRDTTQAAAASLAPLLARSRD